MLAFCQVNVLNEYDDGDDLHLLPLSVDCVGPPCIIYFNV